MAFNSQFDYDRWDELLRDTFKRGSDATKIFDLRYNNMGFFFRIELGQLPLCQVTAQNASNRSIEISVGNRLKQSKSYNT